jgi:hypothetical protein
MILVLELRQNPALPLLSLRKRTIEGNIKIINENQIVTQLLSPMLVLGPKIAPYVKSKPVIINPSENKFISSLFILFMFTSYLLPQRP